MLKGLGIVAAVLTLTQTGTPVLGKATDNAAGRSQNVQQESKSGNNPGNMAIVMAPQNGAGPASPNADDPSAKDERNSVAIRELPPVSVSKDWADWSYWGFGGCWL
jgi:hypothetical protein